MSKIVSKKPGKQRLKIYKGPIHTKRKLIVAPLSKSLQKQHKIKNISIRKGDSIKVMVGNFKGKTGKVEKVDYSKAKIYVKELKYKNARAQEKMSPLVASNLLITDLVLTDEKRLVKKTPNKKGELNGK